MTTKRNKDLIERGSSWKTKTLLTIEEMGVPSTCVDTNDNVFDAEDVEDGLIGAATKKGWSAPLFSI